MPWRNWILVSQITAGNMMNVKKKTHTIERRKVRESLKAANIIVKKAFRGDTSLTSYTFNN
jgi:hypothetical protein